MGIKRSNLGIHGNKENRKSYNGSKVIFLIFWGGFKKILGKNFPGMNQQRSRKIIARRTTGLLFLAVFYKYLAGLLITISEIWVRKN